MASPMHIPAASGSDSPPLMENGDKENICQDRNIVTDCPTLHREGHVATKRKKKPGGFNLRKSIAWNPAFFTEEGVLDNSELSVLSGSQMKANRSPGSGVSGTVSPLCRFGRSGSASVLKEAAENSRGKLLVKYRTAENKGRKLFSPAKTSERAEQRELSGKQDKKSARSIQNSIPLSPAGPKKVPNSNATAQMTITPKKSIQPSIPTVPRSTSSATNMSKLNTKLLPVKTEHPSRVEALQLKSKIKPAPLIKSSRPITEKDLALVVTAIHDEGNSSRKCASYSTYLQNRPSSSVGVPTSTIAKPSALRMPSPSVGFFSQEKALVSHDDAAQGNAKSYFTRNTSSLAKPPRYKQSEYVNSRLSQAPVSNGDTAQGNAKICFTKNTSALAKPPKYKQPQDLKSKLCLTAQLPSNCLVNSEPPVHPVINTLASSLPGLEHDNVCSGKESLSEGIATCLANSRNANSEPTRKVDCLSAGSRATTRSPGSEKNGGSINGAPNAYIVASPVEGRGIVNRTEPDENSHSLKSICSSTIEHVEDSCSDEAIGSSMKPIAASKLSSSCISEVCTLDDFICEKSENCASVATDLENSLAGENMVAVSLSEGNSCTPGPDVLRDFDSHNQQRTEECSTLRKSAESTTCADRVPQGSNSIVIKPASAVGTTDLHGSFCNEAEPNSSEEANTDGAVDFDSNGPLIGKEVQLLAATLPCADFSGLRKVTVDCRTETHDSLAVKRQPILLEEPNTEDDMDVDSDSTLDGKEVQLLIGSECGHDYRSTECPPMEPGAPVPCTDFSDSKEVTIDCMTGTHDSLPVERQLVLLEEPNTEDDMELDTNELSTLEDASPIGKKAVQRSGTNTIIKNHLKQLVPFSEEWLAAMEACGEEVLEQKSGAVQNSPTDKTTPEPSPWSPVESTFDEKYLGLPIPEGRIKNNKLQSTKERLRKKCSDWNEKYMSGSAKETLVKSVAQAMTTYAMSVFKFSAGLCDELSQIIRNFWWGDEEDRRKVHWMNWDKMTRPKSQGGIGFRDLRLFNQALLAKQAWRLIEYPDSLCARVLKAKYYPVGDLLDTAFIQNSSPCWQGISHGLDLLKRGVIWRVVNGSKIKIWRDNWVPRGNLRIIGKARHSRLKWVSDLIDPATNTWNEDLVRSIFFETDAEHVLRIKIPRFVGEDYIAWNHEKSGHFSVRSAYRLAMDIHSKQIGDGASSKPAGERDMWNLIWKTNVPPKVRVFGWKLASNTLGVQAIRHRRNMDQLPTCSICGMEPETSHHAMIRCTKAKALRDCLREDWSLPEEQVLRYTGEDWVLVLLSQVDEEMRAKLLLLWWRCWHLRNNMIFGDGKARIVQSSLFLQSYHSCVLDTRDIELIIDGKGKCPVVGHDAKTTQRRKEIIIPWRRPATGWAKLNFDASFKEADGTGAWGAVLRDEHGAILLSAWGWIPYCPSAETAEAIAGLEGIKATIPCYAGPIHLENDCASLISELRGVGPSKSEIADIVKDIKGHLESMSDSVFSKVNRASNQVAHELAKIGREEFVGRVLIGAVPPCLVELTKSDCKTSSDS